MQYIDDEYEDIVDYDVYWEGSPMYCDGCNEAIESAYGEGI